MVKRGPHGRPQASEQRDHFAGLDVSVKDTSVCIVDDTGKIVREVKVTSEPDVLLAVLNVHRTTVDQVSFPPASQSPLDRTGSGRHPGGNGGGFFQGGRSKSVLCPPAIRDDL